MTKPEVKRHLTAIGRQEYSRPVQLAMEAGLINQVVATDALATATDELARKIAAHSPHAVRSGKRMFYRQVELATQEAYEYAAEIMACDMMSDDATEGIDAFLEKRPATWRGH